MSSTYEAFKKFYHENKARLKMPKANNYPINYKNGKLWASSQCDTESRDFAANIILYTRYVSFSTFFDLLKRVCSSYIKTYSTLKHKDTKFILIVPFKLKKSNMWVSLLAFEFLENVIDDIYYDITAVYNDMRDHRSKLYNKKVRCIICDDCAYTGNQLSYICSFDHASINYANKPVEPDVHSLKWLDWHDNVYKGADEYIKKISLNDFSVDLIIPYMSILAQVRMREFHYVKIPELCIVFPTFAQQVNVEMIPAHIINEFKGSFQYHKDISAIYFDHKIADAISTFNKIYVLAPLFNCAVKNRRVGFIDNCNSTTIPDNLNIYDYYIDMEAEMGSQVCPSTFYKHIKYTFNNVVLKQDAYIYNILKGE